MTTESLQTRAAQLVNREVKYCVSSLVSTLAAGWASAGFQEDVRDDGTKEAMLLMERAYDLASPIPDYEEAAAQAGWTQTPEGWWWREPHEDEPADFFFLGSGPFVRSEAPGAETLCEDEGIEPHEREVYEHWCVSNWLADKLEARGEKVDRDFAGLTVWARTTTGQAIAADSVIEEIVKELDRA